MTSKNYEELKQEYGITFSKEKQKKLETYPYESIKNRVDYLIHSLNINPSWIEKTPSILLNEIKSIEENYDFLKDQNLYNTKEESIFSLSGLIPKNLEETFYYVRDQYGIEIIEENPAILKVPKERLEIIYDLFHNVLTQEQLITASMSRYRIEDISKTIKICLENNITITTSMLKKHPNELQNTIEYIKEEYGSEYLNSSIVIHDKKHIQKVFAYLRGKRCLEIVLTNPSILKLTFEEIIERESYIRQIDQSFVEEGDYNPIFYLSKKTFQEKKKQLLESRVVK